MSRHRERRQEGYSAADRARHLSVEFGTGRGGTNRYRWIVQEVIARGVAGKRDESHERSRCQKERQPLPFSNEKGATAIIPIKEKRGNHGSEKGQQAFRKAVTPVAPTLFKESIYDPFYRLSAPRDAQIAASAFDHFWRAYPKKVALTETIRAFARAIERAPPNEIIRGAMRYAAERRGEDLRYTKHPATWLNKHCWNDLPSTSRVFQRDGPRERSHFNRSAVAQLHDDGDFDEALARIQQQRNKRD